MKPSFDEHLTKMADLAVIQQHILLSSWFLT